MQTELFNTKTKYNIKKHLPATIGRRYSLKVEKFVYEPAEIYERVTNSYELSKLMRILFDADTMEVRETFIAAYFNQSNKLIGHAVISEGGITATVADPRLIFSHALLLGATSIAVAHNHPSGNLTPSQGDKQVSVNLKEAGKLLNIHLLDSLIITESGYYSFRDEGEL